MSNDQKPGDPADKGLDTFVSHRAGYGHDKLARLIDWVRQRPSATLASGEGALLLAEIDRLREGLDAVLRDDHIARNKKILAQAIVGPARAERILAALWKPSESMRNKVLEAYYSSWGSRDFWTVVIHAAVASAEQEVGRE